MTSCITLPKLFFSSSRCRILAFILCFFCHSAVFAYSFSEHLAELLQVKNKIHSLQKTVVLNQEQQVYLQHQLQTIETKLGTLDEQLARLNQSQKEEQKIIADLKITQQKTQQALVMQNKALAQQLRTIYQVGEMQQWKILLNQQDPNTWTRHLTYYRYLTLSRTALITAIKQNLILLTQSIQASEMHQQALKKLVAQKQAQQNHQQQMLHFRKQLLATLGTQTKTKQQQIELLLANQKNLQQTINHLKAQNVAIDGRSFNDLQGKLNWPVKGPLLTSYGNSLNVGDQHSNGIVIKAAPGTPVHAVYSGKVIFANWLRGFGLLVIIHHGHNYITLYARNRAVYATVGQWVKTGDTIASTGNSGGYDEPSLYFEIRQNGSPVNPSIWCR